MALPIPTRSAGTKITAAFWNELVNEINNIYNGVTALQHITIDGFATASEPGVSPSGDARIYYNTTDNEIKASLNAAAYASLFTSPIKAWAHVTNSGTPTLDDSLNVTSLTDDGTGLTTVNFTTAIGDATYAVAAQVTDTTSQPEAIPGTFASGSVQIRTENSTGNVADLNFNVIVAA